MQILLTWPFMARPPTSSTKAPVSKKSKTTSAEGFNEEWATKNYPRLPEKGQESTVSWASEPTLASRGEVPEQQRGFLWPFKFFLHPSFFVSFYIFSRPSHLLLSHSALFLNPLHHSIPFISPLLVICTTVHFSSYTCSHFLILLQPWPLSSLSHHHPRLYTLHIFFYFDFHFSGRTGITYNSLLHLRLNTYHSYSSMASISEDNCLLDFPPHYSSCTILSSPFYFIFQRLYMGRVAWRRSLWARTVFLEVPWIMEDGIGYSSGIPRTHRTAICLSYPRKGSYNNRTSLRAIGNTTKPPHPPHLDIQ